MANRLDARKKRGPYKAYTVDPNALIPRSTKFAKTVREQHVVGLALDRVDVSTPCTVTVPSVDTSNENSVVTSDRDVCEEEFGTGITITSDSETESLADPVIQASEQTIHVPESDTSFADDVEKTVVKNSLGQDLYKGSRLTLATSTILIQTFAIRHSLSEKALSDLLSIIELHCPAQNMCKTNPKNFYALFHTKDTDIKKHYFCGFCGQHGNSAPQMETAACGKCRHELKNEDHFLAVPIETQLQTLLLDHGLTHILEHKEKHRKKDGVIRDVLDGQLYQDVFSNGQHFTDTANKNREVHISLQINTDGVAMYKSSNQSAWPVFLTINELPPALRFTRKYKILAGLWFRAMKPDMNIFLQPFIDELIQLYTKGMILIHNNKQLLIKVVLMSGVFDAPARCAVQSMVQFNGYYGCGTCYVHGESTANLKGTRTHVYPYDVSDEYLRTGHPELRTHIETLEHAEKAEASIKPHLGVKGHAFLASLPKFDIIRGITIDYMHTVLLGVMKMLLNLWISNDYKNMTWYIGDKTGELNERLSALRPPNRITRLPRKIDDLAHWKASELRSFLLYYSVPVLTGLLPDSHLKHFFLLANGTYLLLQSEITEKSRQEAEASIINFCMMMDAFYHKSMEKSNVHALLHLARKVRDLGPLWAHSCFFYEDLNGDLRSLFHGTVNAARQILTTVCIQQELPRMSTELLVGSPAAVLYEQMMSHEKIHSETEIITDGVVAVHPVTPCTPATDLKDVLSEHFGTGDYSNKVFQFERLLLHRQVLHSQVYKAVKRRNSYTVMYDTPSEKCMYGMIKYYLKIQTELGDKYVAVIQQMEMLRKDPHLPSHIEQVSLSDEIVIVPVNNIRQLCIALQGHSATFVAAFPNTAERE